MKQVLKKRFVMDNNLELYYQTMKQFIGSRVTISIAVFLLLVGSFAVSSTDFMGFMFNSNATTRSSSNSIDSSSLLGQSRTIEAYAQTIDQNNTADSLRQLFERTQQSVVQVSSANDPSLFEGDLPTRPTALGSGFVYDQQGHIVTNYHVVAGARDPENIDVTFSDGTIYRARIIGTDQYSDLAVLQIQDPSAIQKMVPLTIGNSSQLHVGDQVAAIGNPFGLTGSLTSGVISGLSRLLPAQASQGPLGPQQSAFSIPDVIQTDAAINPGNSGGPLLNMRGEVVGINTAIFSATGAFAGVGFAVPSNAIAKIVPVLIENGSFEHPWLGISGTDMTPDIASAIGLQESRGFLVIDVTAGGPAESAGIQGGDRLTQIGGRQIELGGDVILAIDNVTVRKIDDLLGYLEAAKEVGETVTLTIWRDGEIIQVDAILAARPSVQASP
ncbi:MAG: trypsin-like peptidase domain-containing protein [Thermoproteota archaeon]|nr:trypsin-like peptidase domain-containing protein [Thermoproteota archaeon]